MTPALDPPLVRERDGIRAVRSRGTFQIVFGAAFVGFGIAAGVNGAGGWTVAIAALAGVLFAASGVVAIVVSRRRLAAFEGEHGVGSGLRARSAVRADGGDRSARTPDAEADREEREAHAPDVENGEGQAA